MNRSNETTMATLPNATSTEESAAVGITTTTKMEETVHEVDYYGVLGCPETASDVELGRAFRKKARQNHPVALIYGNTNANEATFVALCEAHAVLVHPSARTAYDTYGVPCVQAYERQTSSLYLAAIDEETPLDLETTQGESASSLSQAGSQRTLPFARPTTLDEALEYYAQTCGPYQARCHSAGSWISFPYAQDVMTAYSNSVLTARLTFQIRKTQVVVFRQTIIKSKLSLGWTVAENLLTWTILATCKC